MLSKIYNKARHPLYSDLPGLFRPARITGGALSSNNVAFSFVNSNTFQFSRCFIPAVARLWNELSCHVVGSVQLQNFKCSANAFLLSRLF